MVVVIAIVAGGAALWVAGARVGPDRAWWRGRHPLEEGPTLASPRDPASLFREKCLPCHALAGEGGTYGSDLDEVGRRLTRELVAAYIRAPSAIRPDSRMPPARGLTPMEIDSLADYVVDRARSGVAEPGGGR